jgi:hypothetical protein
VSLVKQELPTHPKHLRSSPVSSGVRVTWSLVFCVVLCRSLFVLLYFFIWPLCCLSFVDLRIQITPLVSSRSSYMSQHSSKYKLLSFDHCIVCPFSIYDFRLLLWYLQTFYLSIVLSVLFWFTDSDYSFGIFTFFLHVIAFILILWALCKLSKIFPSWWKSLLTLN